MEARTSSSVRVRRPKVVESGRDVIVASPVAALAAEYLQLTASVKEATERLDAIKADVKARAASGEKLVCAEGAFVIQERRSLSWTLDAVKGFFGRNWTAYVKPDDKMLKAVSDERVAALADVTVVEAVTFKKA